MTHWKNSLVLSCFILSAGAAGLGAADKPDLNRLTPVPAGEQIPLGDFFRPRLMADPVLNLAGTHIAALIAGSSDHTELMVYDLKSQKVERLPAQGDSDVRSVNWLNSQRVIFTVDATGRGGFGLFAGNVGSIHHSYPLLQSIGASLVAVPPKDRTHPVLQLARNSMNTGKYGEIVTADTEISTGKMIDTSKRGVSEAEMDEGRINNEKHILRRFPIIKTNNSFDLTYYADKAGQPAFSITSEGGVYSLQRLVGENWEKCPENLDEITVLGAGDNPGEIVVLGERKDNKPRPLQVMNAATGTATAVLLQDKAYDFNGWLYHDPVSQNIIGAFYDRGAPQSVWFNESYQNLQKAVDGLFPGKVVRILGTDEAVKMVLLSSFSDRQPPIYSWVDLGKHAAGLIKNSAPWIDPQRMQAMGIIKFKTRDGKQLDAYLTLPAGASKKNPPPLVVLPHDGPAQRNTWGFDSEVQFLASRGYAVLQPNYRGSPGYTWMFPESDEWAYRKMHEDVTDATKAVIGAGLVDKTRVAIMGTRFGGYLAMSGVAFEPSLYRCAAAVSPVLDWARELADQKFYQYSNANYSRMVRKLGDPSAGPDKFDVPAPGQHADQIRVPVFIANGEYDSAVEISAVKDLVSALKRRDISADSITFLNEVQHLERLDHKLEYYAKIEVFLAKNMAPLPGAAAPATGSP